MNIAEVEAKLVDACEKAIVDGWTIAPGRMFGVGVKECCALGAFVAPLSSTFTHEYHGGRENEAFIRAIGTLGIDHDQGAAIARAFDGRTTHGFDSELADLGARLRARYVKP